MLKPFSDGLGMKPGGITVVHPGSNRGSTRSATSRCDSRAGVNGASSSWARAA